MEFEIGDASELDALLSESDYKAYLETIEDDHWELEVQHKNVSLLISSSYHSL